MLDPVFGTMFWGKMLSASGVWIHSIVAAIVTFDLTGSTFMVGLVTVVQFAPQLALAPLSGKWADRGHAARQIVIGRLVCALGSGGLALWFWLGSSAEGRTGAIPVLVASLVVGLGFVIGGPAMQSIIPALIRPGELSAAMALNTLPLTIARVAGPPLGALVATHIGPEAAFAIAAAAQLVFALVLFLIRLPRGNSNSSDSDFSIRVAIRHVRADRPLLFLLIGISAIGFGSEPSITLAPALAHDLGGAPGLVGWFVSVLGIGAGVGFLLLGRLQRRFGIRPLASAGLFVMGVGLLIPAITGSDAVVLVAFGLSGMGLTIGMTSVSTQVLDRSPGLLRGRIMALWLMGFLGARPVAAGMDGLLADLYSVRVAFGATAVFLVAAAYLCRPGRLAAPAPGESREREEPMSPARITDRFTDLEGGMSEKHL
jgi:MFS family permease